ncbi:hypothetical protein Q1695_009199 [Nippostrongylus brasiliensis]|nr:hypothetical protein Q1695_009199 [Nippostrongylus brasiliensis]
MQWKQWTTDGVIALHETIHQQEMSNDVMSIVKWWKRFVYNASAHKMDAEAHDIQQNPIVVNGSGSSRRAAMAIA